ncbi:MAG: phosphotransferase [Microbacterium ginsengisoli]|nr:MULTISPECIES: phosphotransferase [unclassified Microbacterium]KQR94021.1 hypothetical protein ASF93_03645 [Microbacterium sp. Leaf347]KQR97122.1 hypothetical protein ASG00_12695 [Microbacterium sp. Leaf351]MBN9198335.1 phosphotransferase [Microbacterium ginsengisoli]
MATVIETSPPPSAGGDPMGGLVSAALEAWGIEASAPVTFIKHRENVVYRVDSARLGALALRFHRVGYHSDAELASELGWVRTLERAGVRVPEVVPDRDGRLWAPIRVGSHQRNTSVQRWIDGAGPLGDVGDLFAGEPLHPDLRFETLGDLAARCHTVAERGTPAGFDRRAWDADALTGPEPLWGDPSGLRTLDAADRRVLDQARVHLRRDLAALPVDRDHAGIVHADMTPENVLISPSGELTLIDFDDFGESWYLFDLATAMFFATPRSDYPALRDALFHGYRARRSLTAPELASWDALLLARGMTYLGWSAARPGNEAEAFISGHVAPWVVRAAHAYVTASPLPWTPLTPTENPR